MQTSRTIGLQVSTPDGLSDQFPGQLTGQLTGGAGATEFMEYTVAGAVFDCDGLLVDSESIWLRMLADWLQEQDMAEPPPAEDFLGFSVEDTAVKLADQDVIVDSAQSIAGQLTSRYSALVAQDVRPMPGVADLLTSLTDQIPIAVASNGLRRDITTMLGGSDLLPRFNSLCTVEDVPAAKPAPDLYLEACRRITVTPEHAVAFEDSPAGARAALAAGLTVIGVNPDPAIELPGHARLTSLDQVSISAPPQDRTPAEPDPSVTPR